MEHTKDLTLLDAIEKTTSVGTWTLDFQSQHLTWSANTKRIHDVPLDYEPNLETAINFYVGEFRTELHSHIYLALEHQIPISFTSRIKSATGRNKWVKVFGRADPKQAMLYGAIQDVTEEVELSEHLTALIADRYRTTDHLIEAVFYYNSQGQIVSSNSAAQQLFLYANEQMRQLNIQSLLDTDSNIGFNFKPCTDNEKSYKITARRADGSTFPALLTTSVSENLGYCLAIFRDLTGEINTLKRIEQLTFFDELTGLPNRHQLISLLEQDNVLSRNLIAININNFNKINLACGHDEGDKVLVEFARLLNQLVGDSDIIIRDLADRFFVLQNVDSTDGESNRYLLASTLLSIQDTPVMGKEPHYISLSIGVAPVVQSEKAHESIARAESALLATRATPLESMHVYAPSDFDTQRHQYLVEQKLRLALDCGDIMFWLQPKVDRNAKPISAELLVRWIDENGNTPFHPDEFIPIAEESGLIATLGFLAIEFAAQCIARLKSIHPTLTISVNVSPSQFMSKHFVATLQDVFNQNQARLDRLVIEVTENLLLHDEKEVENTIAQLRLLGVNIALDDFGTGYSNLKRILDLNIDEIKIDKSLLINFSASERSKAILDSVISMGKGLNIPLTAEGVETLDIVLYCQHSGVQYMQGYYFAKPMPIQNFLSWLLESSKDT